MSAAEAVSNLNNAPKVNGVELVLYEKVGIGASGSDANNPFLQELPDPVSKATWGNYVAVPQKMAKEASWEQGDIVKVTANGYSIELPILVQPGQASGTISIALGYGRTKVGKVGDQVGANAIPLASTSANGIMYAAAVKVERTEATRHRPDPDAPHHHGPPLGGAGELAGQLHQEPQGGNGVRKDFDPRWPGEAQQGFAVG